MRYQTRLIMSLLMAFGLCGALLAAPPPADNQTAAKMQKQRITGMVESVQGQKATIRTGNGQHVQVNLGPESYWREHGYHLNPGRQVTVEGWRREGDDNRAPFFAGGIWGPDFYFELTNGNGFPMWADQDDYWDGWYPTYDYYDAYYYGPAPYAYGPPPHWWGGPPPPPWWYRHHHFYGRPGFRWGWHDRWNPGPRPHDGRRHDGRWNDRRDGRGNDRHNRDQNDGGRQGDHGDQGDHHDQRGGERRH